MSAESARTHARTHENEKTDTEKEENIMRYNDMKNYNWYTLLIGNTKKSDMTVIKELRRLVENCDLIEVAEVRMATETEIKIVNGKEKAVVKNRFPGYIFVRAESTEGLRERLKYDFGIVSFLKDNGKICPLSDSESPFRDSDPYAA